MTLTDSEILSITALSCLGICLFTGLAMMAVKGKKKDTCGKVCGFFVFAAVALLAVRGFIENSKSGFRTERFDSGNTKLVILSADSWCGYSKKASAAEQAVKNALKDLNVELEMVKDSSDKQKFDKLSKEFNAKGFPHNLVFVDGKKVAEFGGYMPVDKIKAKVAEVLKKN